MASQSLERVLAQRWRRLNKRQQAVAIIIGSLVGMWSMDAVALRPLRHQVHHLRQEVRDTEQRVAEAIAANDQAKAVNRAFGAYEPYAQPSGSSEAALASVLSEVEAAVRQSGVGLLGLKPASGRSSSAETVSVTVDGESSAGQLVQLLDLLQRSPHLLKVTELNVRISEGKMLRSSLVISKLLLK